MKRSLITSSLAALGVAFLLPLGASAATVTNATAGKHTTTAKSATAAKSTTAAKTESATPAKNATATKPARHHAMARNAAATKAKTTKVDINTATREELMTLPGIDGAMADKIIEGRPYKNMAQLKTKGGVTNAEYRKISRKVTARQSTMHSEAPANGTQSMESGAQNEAGGEGAASASGSSETTK